MKKALIFILALGLLVACTTYAWADTVDTSLHVYDGADLLTADEEATLREQIDRLIDDYHLDIVILTTDDVQGYSAQEYAELFYDENGFGYGNTYDGLLLLVAMDIREYWTATDGAVTATLSSQDINYMHSGLSSGLSRGDYYYAFVSYLELVEDVLVGDPTDPTDLTGGSRPPERAHASRPLLLIFIILVLAAIIAGSTVAIMARKNRMVKSAVSASNYVDPGSLNLRVKSDTFLRTHTVTMKVASSDSSGGGRGHGHSHGGGGGRF